MNATQRMLVQGSILLLTVAPAGCIPSNVIDVEQRAVRRGAIEQVWRTAEESHLRGFWASESVRGPGAETVLRLYYYFAADQRFTGAALITGDRGAEFQTLSGSWSLADGQLDLGDGSPALRAEAGGRRLRLSSADGDAIFQREELQ
ncbi:MAG: hypothetical protein ACKVX7_09410 [Planctomycetota bacterium]